MVYSSGLENRRSLITGRRFESGLLRFIGVLVIMVSTVALQASGTVSITVGSTK